MSTIVIHSEEELQQKFLELVHYVNNMRQAQKYWHIHFGYAAKKRKETLEKKVDGLLNLLGVSEHQNLRSIQLIKDGDEFIIHPTPTTKIDHYPPLAGAGSPTEND